MAQPGDHASEVDEAVMDLLAGHVPLTLLVDLADVPASEELLAEEGLPDGSWWETPTEG